jgi:hypothetical protein
VTAGEFQNGPFPCATRVATVSMASSLPSCGSAILLSKVRVSHRRGIWQPFLDPQAAFQWQSRSQWKPPTQAVELFSAITVHDCHEGVGLEPDANRGRQFRLLQPLVGHRRNQGCEGIQNQQSAFTKKFLTGLPNRKNRTEARAMRSGEKMRALRTALELLTLKELVLGLDRSSFSSTSVPGCVLSARADCLMTCHSLSFGCLRSAM